MSDPNASSVLRYEPKPTAPVPQPFDRLKELVANGYVPDPGTPGEAGLLLRHRSAPDLILFEDGRIEVPIGQPAKGGRRFSNWSGWFKFAVLVAIGFVFWLISVTATVSILESM